MPDLLHYKILGDGQPLVIVHGLFGSLDNWITLARRFSEHYKVVLVDQRNHGKSFHDDVFDYEAMSADLERLISDLALENPILLGHSMGGKTVMQYCAFHSDRIDKLIVADIGPKAYPVHHSQIIEGLRKIDFKELKRREEADSVLEPYIADIGVRSFLLKNLKRASDGALAWKMNLEVIANNIENVGTALNYYLPMEVPTLFLRGEKSGYIQESDEADIEEIFLESTVHTIQNAGHWIHAEQPDQFYDEVMRFLNQ